MFEAPPQTMKRTCRLSLLPPPPPRPQRAPFIAVSMTIAEYCSITVRRTMDRTWVEYLCCYINLSQLIPSTRRFGIRPHFIRELILVCEKKNYEMKLNPTIIACIQTFPGCTELQHESQTQTYRSYVGQCFDVFQFFAVRCL